MIDVNRLGTFNQSLLLCIRLYIIIILWRLFSFSFNFFVKFLMKKKKNIFVDASE